MSLFSGYLYLHIYLYARCLWGHFKKFMGKWSKRWVYFGAIFFKNMYLFIICIFLLTFWRVLVCVYICTLYRYIYTTCIILHIYNYTQNVQNWMHCDLFSFLLNCFAHGIHCLNNLMVDIHFLADGELKCFLLFLFTYCCVKGRCYKYPLHFSLCIFGQVSAE